MIWDYIGDLNQVANFLLNTLQGIFSIVSSTILIFSVGLWVLGFVVKLFKKVLG